MCYFANVVKSTSVIGGISLPKIISAIFSELFCLAEKRNSREPDCSCVLSKLFFVSIVAASLAVSKAGLIKATSLPKCFVKTSLMIG